MKLIDKLTKYTDVNSTNSTIYTHGIHPYPAKFIPELPREIIMECTKERNVVLDPFCGSGTTLLEACIAGRKSIGIDSNPVATLISRAKTTALTELELQTIEVIISQLEEQNYTSLCAGWTPSTTNLNHWFQPCVITELSWLRQFILDHSVGNLQVFLLCIFSSIIVNVSNQESNTRYAAIDKNFDNGVVLNTFIKKLKHEYKRICQVSEMKTVIKNTPTIIHGSTDCINDNIIPDSSVDIVITSPPYANSYDYYLYHKWRMAWLGYDVKKVQNDEIGSRHEHSSQKAPISVFEHKMIPVMKNISRMLKPNKLAYFFVGDSIISGELFDMEKCFKEIAKKSNFAFVDSSKYTMKSITRSFHEKKYSDSEKKMQHILVFEPIKTKTFISCDSKIIAKPKSACEVVDLSNAMPEDNSIISIQSGTDFSKFHSLGKYPAKFIPDLPAWAILHYSKAGEVVFDPFNGCGTTTTEARLNGRYGVGFDISPYACLLARTKTSDLSATQIEAETTNFLNFLSNNTSKKIKRTLYFENDLFWFSKEALVEFEAIRDYITCNYDGQLRDYFMSVLSTIIKPCSYLDESQIKVKRDQKKLLKGTPSPFEIMKKALVKYSSIVSNGIECNQTLLPADIINDSALNIKKHIVTESVDLVVTSPPYINAMNYAMNNRYESFLLNLVDPEDSIDYQTKFIGTERVYARDYSILHQFDTHSVLGQALNDILKQIYDKEPKRSYIVYKYFSEMKEVLYEAADVLKKGKRFVLVAGTNTITGIHIDTFSILVKVLEDYGLIHEKVFHYEIVKNALKITRHKTSDIIKYDGVAVLRKEM
ncbi:MAG: site-specific DNA-methyltransferase [Oscillospiraceae bacterium]|nr:site-specific DNA-methyltransferase [Oscillospiraceae bacterium]